MIPEDAKHDSPVSPSDPLVVLAGIKHFGLAGDRADIRDLEAGIARLVAQRDEALEEHIDMMWQRRRADERAESAEAAVAGLTAERDELAAWKAHIVDHADRKKRPFSDRFAQAVIASQVRTIDEIYGRMNGWFLERDRLKAELARLREALKPSKDTKAAYIGESKFTANDCGDFQRFETVPWTTIKEIMAAISARAALRTTSDEEQS